MCIPIIISIYVPIPIHIAQCIHTCSPIFRCHGRSFNIHTHLHFFSKASRLRAWICGCRLLEPGGSVGAVSARSIMFVRPHSLLTAQYACKVQ